MSSEENQSSFATKGQLKILIERIRHIENQQSKLKSKISDVSTTQDLKIQLEDLTKNIDTQITKLTSDLTHFKTEISNLKNSMQKREEFQTNAVYQIKDLEDKIPKLEGFFEEVQSRFSGISKRFENVEKYVGITSGVLTETGFDSGGMLREFVGELFGIDQIDLFVLDDINQNPISAIKTIKKIIMKLSGMDEYRISNISEILLRYADKMEDSGVSGRKELFVGFNTDVRRICEIGQSVLMDIGQKRNLSRRICQEAKNLAGKWTSEEILKSEIGVIAVLELFDTLEEEFSVK
ncbi:MAG: hypothetical protein ACFFAU_18875 [Candidatus Hodarchaeota archaeon]